MRKILNFAATTAIFSGLGYAYIKYHTSKNFKQYRQIIDAGSTKDASRLTNESFGISWGFQADDIVMNKIDSGDYLFIKFQCHQCISVEGYLKCFMSSMFNLEQQFDSIGYAYRNAEGLFILYNQFGETKIKRYSQLVSLPYLKGLVIQKNKDNNISIHKALKKMLESTPGQIAYQQVNQSAVHMANRINKQIFKQKAYFVSDLRQLIQTSQQILVRTETNRTLRTL